MAGSRAKVDEETLVIVRFRIGGLGERLLLSLLLLHQVELRFGDLVLICLPIIFVLVVSLQPDSDDVTIGEEKWRLSQVDIGHPHQLLCLALLAALDLDLLIAVNEVPLEGIRHKLGELDVLDALTVQHLPAKGLQVRKLRQLGLGRPGELVL